MHEREGDNAHSSLADGESFYTPLRASPHAQQLPFFFKIPAVRPCVVSRLAAEPRLPTAQGRPPLAPVERPLPQLPHINAAHSTQAPSSCFFTGRKRGVVFHQVYFTWLCVDTVREALWETCSVAPMPGCGC